MARAIRLPHDSDHSKPARLKLPDQMRFCAPAIDILALASSLGIPSRRIERAGDIAGAVEEGIRSGCLNLIELPIMP
ncbi:hypothetical protein EPZ47_11140 [Pseudomonas viciae]|uniref:Uncharacterized protein n=1 Tax=Pseudomonas viciae TaxID=2505979 RepID=A0A4P7PFI4_9PSED|nr:hypothetical protein EPZ47_11140 [Pseudomonas viciae]